MTAVRGAKRKAVVHDIKGKGAVVFSFPVSGDLFNGHPLGVLYRNMFQAKRVIPVNLGGIREQYMTDYLRLPEL